MKKSLLLSLAVGLAMSASAQWLSMPNLNAAPAGPANAQGAKWFTYCQGAADGIGTGKACNIGGAMLIPTANPLNSEDFTITKVGVCVGAPCSAQTATLFITTGLDKEPAYTQVFTPGAPFEWLDIDLETPYQLSHSPLYIGYYLTATASDYPIAFDNVPTSATVGGYIGYNASPDAASNDFTWENAASQFGSVAVRAWVEGVYPDLAYSISDFVTPKTVGVNKEFETSFKITNDGTDPIASVTYSYAFTGYEGEIVTKNFENAIPLGASETITLPACTLVNTGSITGHVSVEAVNGVAVESQSLTAQFEASLCATPRMMVIEENTCVGCGYCVYGIVGVEHMTSKYPGNVAGIVVHNTAQSADAMAVSYYTGMPSGGGNPSSYVNRESKFNDAQYNNVYPDMYTLENIYLSDFNGAIGNADVFIESAEWTDGTMSALNLKSKANFGSDNANAKYRWVYVMLEDNVGPYNQANYLAGQNAGEAGGDWPTYGQSQSWYYSDVLRWANGYNGTTASALPTAIAAGESYEFEQEVPLTGLKNTANAALVIKPEDTRFLAMVVCTSPKSILNAAMINAADVTFPEGIADQTVTWNTEFPESAAIGDAITLDATASSGEEVTYMVQCPNGVATLSGNTLTFKKAGLVKVHAIQAGSESVKRASAMKELVVTKKPQTITWDQEFDGIEVNKTFTLQATSTSGLSVNFKILTANSGARISNGKLTFTKPATIEVQAYQNGNNTYMAAEPVVRTITCEESGIEGVKVDLDNAIYFNLQGVQVANPVEGEVYIVVSGDKAYKIVK